MDNNNNGIKNTLRSSTRVIVIALIILVLIFLSFLMVKIVPQVLSSMANSTVSITSAFFPSSNQASTSNGTSSGVTLNTTTATGNVSTSTASTTAEKNESFLTKFFGPRKTDNNNANAPVNFSVATSTRQNTNDNNVTYNDRNTGSSYQSSSYQRVNGVPDLAVQITSIGIIGSNGVFVTTNNFTTTDTVVVKFKVENQGTAATGAWTMRVNMPSSNAIDQIKTISSGGIPAGRALTGQAVFNTPAVGLNQQVTINVDPNGAIAESNENNNQASIALNVTQANNYYNNGYNNNYNYNNNNSYNYNCNNGTYNGYNNNNCNISYTNNTPNLTVREVALGKMDIYNQFTQTTYLRTADKAAIKFEVTNNSSVYSSGWTWKAQIVGPNPYQYANYNYGYNNGYNNGYTYNSDGSRTYNPTITESGLAPGETRTYTVTFDGLTYGSNYITIIVDSANNIIETNEGDNTISQTFFVNY